MVERLARAIRITYCGEMIVCALSHTLMQRKFVSIINL